MSWIALSPEEQETIFQSESITDTLIAADLKTVVDRMIQNKEEDQADSAQQLLFRINAANGLISINWWDQERSRTVGNRMYELLLSNYWETDNNSFNFDKVCRIALLGFVKEHLLPGNRNRVCNVYVKTELSGIEEILS